MHPDIVKLLDLQEKDLTLSELDAEMESVEVSLRELDLAVEAAREQVEAMRRAAVAAAEKRDELEKKMEAHRVHQERRREKLEFVKGKDLNALTAEIDMARSVLANVESEWVRASDQAQAAQARIAEAEKAVEELHASQAEERARLGAEATEVEGRREGAVAQRKSSAKVVEKPLLIQYNRLRSTRKTAVVVPLVGPTCGSCFTAVPINRRAQIRSGALIAGCETCGVILYANEEG